MTRGRMLALFGLAVGMVLMGSGQSRADEIAPPEGSKNEFVGSPIMGTTTVEVAGKYTLVEGWSLSNIGPLQLRVYKVVTDKDGKKTKGDLVVAPSGDKGAGDLWTAQAKGLTSDTEYFVEGKVKLAKNGTVNDYAFRYTEAALVKTKKAGCFMDEGGPCCPPVCPPPP